MAATFKLELVSPERVVLAADNAEQVQLPGTDGDFTVLAGHAPVISLLRPGVLEIQLANGKKRVFVKGGFVEVDPAHVTILAEKALDVAELSPERLAAERKAAEADLAEAKDDNARFMAQSTLECLRAF